MKTDLQFRFEKEALDVALATGSARVTFSTPGKAVQFRQRCYSFRKWKRETLGDESPYELLTIKSLAKGATVIEIVGRQFEGTIIPGAGSPITSPVREEPEMEFSEDELSELDEVIKKVGSIEL